MWTSLNPMEMDGTFQIMCDGSGNFSSTFSPQGRRLAWMHQNSWTDAAPRGIWRGGGAFSEEVFRGVED